jgi:hypothetical protein
LVADDARSWKQQPLDRLRPPERALAMTAVGAVKDEQIGKSYAPRSVPEERPEARLALIPDRRLGDRSEGRPE